MLSSAIEDPIQQRLPRTGLVLLGVSGGADSMALLYAAAVSLPAERLIVVHVHHGLRGKAADLDAAFVQAQCAKLGVRCELYRGQVSRKAKREGLSLETAGRKLRHECFLHAARHSGAKVVMLAHHQDDQAETLLFNLFRGTAGRGLVGLQASRPFPHPLAPAGLLLLRPFLGLAKSELEGYLTQRKLRWREDASNRDPRFSRNQIRHRVLPRLEKWLGRPLAPRLARTAAAVGRDEQLLEHLTQAAHQRLLLTGGKLKRPALLRLAEALQWRVLGQTWDERRIPWKSSEHLTRVLELAHLGRGQIQLPGGWQARADLNSLWFQAPAARARVQNPKAHYGVQCVNVPRPKSPVRLPARASFILVDAGQWPRTIRLRNARPGDVFQPLGLAGKRKDLKKVWSELKVPLERRSTWPLLADRHEILWIFRGPMSERVKITDRTQRVLRVAITEKSPQK